MQPDPSLDAALPARASSGTHACGAPTDPQPLTVAFGIDNRFAIPLSATLHSLLDGLSGGERPHLYILSTAGRAIHAPNRDRLRRVVRGRAQLHWPTLDQLPIDPALLQTSEHLSLATHYRVFLPTLLPPACRRILYLDADVIVRGDLRALWEQDLGTHVALAVRDPAVFTLASPMGLRKQEALGLPADAPYFNGGVLLIDVEKWRTQHITQQFIRYTEQYGRSSRWGDQDGLNAVLHARWGLLDERWNLQTYLYDRRAAPASPAHQRYLAALRARSDELTTGSFIIHYTRGRKPWHPRCPHPYRHLFHEHFRQSGCFRFRPAYAAWYASRYLAWFYAKITTPRTWKKAWKRTWRLRTPITSASPAHGRKNP